MTTCDKDTFGIFDIMCGTSGGDRHLMESVIGLYSHARQRVQQLIETDIRDGLWAEGKDEGDDTPEYEIFLNGERVYYESPVDIVEE